MSNNRRTGGWGCLVAALATLLPGPVTACDDPVYRYALERWPPDDFRLVMESSTRESLRRELASLESRGPRPNVAVLDIAEAERVGRRPEPGRILLLAPPDGSRSGSNAEVWSGPATAATLAGIAESPARRELVERLIAGEAIVWVVVERGEAAGDERLDGLIAEYVREVAAADAEREDVPPPETEEAAAGKPLDKSVFWPPRMSVLRVHADDPREQVLVASLMAAAEPEVAAAAAVFPVFGRGRTLGGVLLAKLAATDFRSACDFLVGACSCEVKELSPGSDLLLAANWDAVPRLIRRRGADADADFAEQAATAAPNEDAAPTTEQTPAATTPQPSGRRVPPLAVWLVGAAGLLACLAWLARSGR